MPPKQPIVRNASGPTLPVMTGSANSINFSQDTQLALSGGLFDARVFFKKPKLTGIDEVDEKGKLIFRNKVKLMDLLCQHEDLVAGALGWVEDKVMGVSLMKKSTSATKHVPNWPTTYIYMEKIPKYWRAEFLLTNLGSLGLTSKHLSDIDVAHPSGINEMFDFLLAFHARTKIPRVCLDKEVMMSFFNERLADMGRASGDWLCDLTNGWSTPPVLNWARAGCYTVVKENLGLTLKHVSGTKVPPQSYTLSPTKPNGMQHHELSTLAQAVGWLEVEIIS